jgi:hypothetical protein
VLSALGMAAAGRQLDVPNVVGVSLGPWENTGSVRSRRLKDMSWSVAWKPELSFPVSFLFLLYWGLNSGLCAC